MNPVSMVVADLKSMRGTALAIIGVVAIALALLIGLSAQERAFRQASARAADDFPLVVGAPGSAVELVLGTVYLEPGALPLLDPGILERLQADKRARGVAPVAAGDVYRGYPLVGTHADFVTRWGRLTVTEGRVFAAEGEAVAGADVDVPLGTRFEASHRTDMTPPGVRSDDEEAHVHHGTGFHLVGRLPRTFSAWDRAILVPIERIWEMHAGGHASQTGKVPAIVVKPVGIAEAYQLRGDYRQNGSMAVFPGEVLVSLYGIAGQVQSLLSAALLGNFALILLLIVVILLAMAHARQVRYVTLRALGADRAFIGAVLWLSAAALVAAGAGLALPVFYALSPLLAAAIHDRTGLTLQAQLGLDELATLGAVTLICFAVLFIATLVFLRRERGFDLLRE